MKDPSDPDSAAVFDFVDDYLADLEADAVRPLAAYLGRYPGHEEAVAREYLRLRGTLERVRVEPPASEPDERRVGPYRLIEELGRGGQGAVYLAEDTRIARRVALKLLTGAFVSEERRARLRREAEAIARLEHAGICHVHEAQIEGDRPYIAMRFIQGDTISRLLENARTGQDGRLPWKPRGRRDLVRVLAVFERAARALHAAHVAGVVHRDVKPGNVMITPAGEPVLLDFGLAWDDRAASRLTAAGDAFGTLEYMSPEQVRGARELGPSSDVYSLGASLFEALTLERPFAGLDRVALTRAILEAPVPDARAINPDLPAEVQVLLETALEKDPSRRYASALELAEDLRRVREFEPIQARPAGAPLRFRRWVRREPALATAVVGSLVVLSVGLVLSLVFNAREQRALDFALGRHLADRSNKLLEEDPSGALALGVRSVSLAPSYLTRSALFAGLEECALERQLHGTPLARVNDLAVEGTVVAACLGDGAVELWDLDSGATLARTLLPAPAQRVAWTASGLLALGAERITLLDKDTLAPLATRELSNARAALAVHGGRVGVLTGALLTLFDARDLTPLETFPLTTDASAWLEFAPDGERFLVGRRVRQAQGVSGPARVVDVHSGAVRALGEAGQELLWTCFAPDGTVVTADAAGRVRFWDAAGGAECGPALEHDGPVACAAPDPSGRRLAVTTADRQRSGAWIHDLDSGAVRELVGHKGSHIVRAVWDPAGERVATVSYDMTVRVWDAASGRELRSCRALFQPWEVHWVDGGRRLLTRSNSSWARVWRVGSFPDCYPLDARGADVTWAGFAPDGERALTGAADGVLRVWSTPSAGTARPGVELARLTGHTAAVVGGAFGTAQSFVSWSRDGTARLWDLARAESLRTFDAGGALARGVLSPDGAWLALVREDGVLQLRHLAGEAQGEPLAAPLAAGCRAVAFAPDGQRWAAAGDHGRVVLCEAGGGELWSAELPGGASVLDLAFDPRGRVLALACDDGRLRYRNVAGGAEARPDQVLFVPRRLSWGRSDQLLVFGSQGHGSIRIEDQHGGAVRPEVFHTGHLTDAALSPDGRWVVSGSHDASVYVWDAATGQPFVHRTGYGGPIRSVSFAPLAGDGRVLVAAPGGAAVWPIDPLPAAQGRLPRTLESWEHDRERRLAEPLRYRPSKPVLE